MMHIRNSSPFTILKFFFLRAFVRRKKNFYKGNNKLNRNPLARVLLHQFKLTTVVVVADLGRHSENKPHHPGMLRYAGRTTGCYDGATSNRARKAAGLLGRQRSSSAPCICQSQQFALIPYALLQSALPNNREPGRKRKPSRCSGGAIKR